MIRGHEKACEDDAEDDSQARPRQAGSAGSRWQTRATMIFAMIPQLRLRDVRARFPLKMLCGPWIGAGCV